jgi:hypothetical protein
MHSQVINSLILSWIGVSTLITVFRDAVFFQHHDKNMLKIRRTGSRDIHVNVSNIDIPFCFFFFMEHAKSTLVLKI